MWHYFVVHCAYHLPLWFSRDRRRKVKHVFILFSFVVLIPQLYIIQIPHDSQICDDPFLNIGIANIVFTLAMIAFALLFVTMEPVPWQLKIAFHLFGCGSLIFGIVLLASTVASEFCSIFIPELYYMCVVFGVAVVISTGFFVTMCPFWLIDYLWPDSVLSRQEGHGICYERVTYCPLLWHV